MKNRFSYRSSPQKKTLVDFDFSFRPSIDKRQIEERATMRFVENAENSVSLGPPGVGRPIWLLLWAWRQLGAAFPPTTSIATRLLKARFENRQQDRLKILSGYRLLIIDEIGYLPMDARARASFFSSLPGAAKRFRPSLLQTRPSPNGMKSCGDYDCFHDPRSGVAPLRRHQYQRRQIQA